MRSIFQTFALILATNDVMLNEVGKVSNLLWVPTNERYSSLLEERNRVFAAGCRIQLQNESATFHMV